MAYRVKDWEKFQHFKDRSPPWVKLYKYLLDDPDWHELDAESAKILVMLWLVASEDPTKEGVLPSIKKTAFRLHITEAKLNQSLTKLYHWVIHDDISAISSRYQVDAPERAGEETETETETDAPAQNSSARFEEFWLAYPKKKSKGDAEKAFKALKVDAALHETILSAISVAKQSAEWQKDGGQFIQYPATWLRARGWEDEPMQAKINGNKSGDHPELAGLEGAERMQRWAELKYAGKV